MIDLSVPVPPSVDYQIVNNKENSERPRTYTI